MKLEEVIQRDDRASQPAATTVPIGTLYYVTDENVTERSNGTTWDDYSDAGGTVTEAFKTIAVSGQSDVVADSATDTLTLAAGSNITLTTNAGTDTITIAASGGSAGLVMLETHTASSSASLDF